MIKKKILITGANGLLGSKFCFFLKKKKIRFKKINSIKELNFKNKNFTHIIHFKYFIGNNKLLKKNKIFTKKISDLCFKNNIKLIFISSIAAKYRKNQYGKSKFFSELFFRKKLKKLIILRPHNIYTNNIEKHGVISDFIRKMKNKKKINLKFYNNKRDFLYFKDFFEVIIKALNYKKNAIFEIGSGKTYSIFSLANIINNYFNFGCKITKTLNKSNFSYNLSSNIKKTSKILNWHPKVNLKQGLYQIKKTNKNLTT